jgi:tetratricopeptide (TPR) repeat protein
MLVAVGAPAWAQAPNPAADASLRKGRALMRAGRFHEACDAFEESQRLDPQLGTLFTLAACEEKVGKITSAWLAYRDIASRDSNRDRRRRANELATRLVSRVPKLLLQIDQNLPGLSVTLSGKDITEHVGVDIPVDPGAYSVVATATGFNQITRDIKIVADGKVLAVEMKMEPTREATAAEPSHAEPVTPEPQQPAVDKPVVIDKPAPPTSSPSTSHLKTYAAIAIAAGGVGIAASVGVGVSARNKWNRAKEQCGSSQTCPDQESLDAANALRKQAASRGDLATVIGIASGVAIASGITMWLLAPSDHVAVTPTATATSAGVTVSGVF